jgi:hypothetical protein
MPAASTAAREPRSADMAERVPFLLRLDPEVLAALRRWAGDDMRSLNAQIEFLLRRTLRDVGRLPDDGRATQSKDEAPPD